MVAIPVTMQPKQKDDSKQVAAALGTMQLRQEGDSKQAQVTIQSREALLLDEKKAVVFVVQAEPREPSSLLLRPNWLLVRPRQKPCPTTPAS